MHTFHLLILLTKGESFIFIWMQSVKLWLYLDDYAHTLHLDILSVCLSQFGQGKDHIYCCYQANYFNTEQKRVPIFLVRGFTNPFFQIIAWDIMFLLFLIFDILYCFSQCFSAWSYVYLAIESICNFEDKNRITNLRSPVQCPPVQMAPKPPLVTTNTNTKWVKLPHWMKTTWISISLILPCFENMKVVITCLTQHPQYHRAKFAEMFFNCQLVLGAHMFLILLMCMCLKIENPRHFTAH